MQGEHSKQSSFFSMIYEELIPANQVPGLLIDPHARKVTADKGYSYKRQPL